MKISSILMFFQVFFLLLLLISKSVIAEEVEDESEFNYIEGDKRGPENWGNIKVEWAKCKTGNRQSPISIPPRLPERIPGPEKITRFYQPAETTLKNRGHDIKLEWEKDGGMIRINGTNYILRQCHWHSPSEHAINGRRYALEVHFVHQSLDNKIAVIGFLYDYGYPDPFLSSIEDKIRLISNNSSEEIPTGVVNPQDVRLEGSTYYRYMGSLTTPSCDEGVIWSIETKIGSVSIGQVKLLRDAVDDDSMENARPLQPVNGRRVRLYDTRLRIEDETLPKHYASSK